MTGLLGLLTDASNALYGAFNALSGRSWLVDMLIALPIDNALVKAGPIAACFAYAWYSARDEGEALRRRGILLVTLGSLVLVLATTKTMSKEIFLPRPYLLSQPVFVVEADRLVPAERLEYRVPQDGDNRDRFEQMRRGEVMQNDLGSFPSDHAAFYFALALGVFLACRRAGLIALGWALVAIMASRIITGMHSPLDIFAGAAIGGALLGVSQFAFARWATRITGRLAALTRRHEGLSSALLFLVLFEAANTLTNTEHLLWRLKEMAQSVAGA